MKNVCFSNNVIEQQAYIISEKIIKDSIYKPIRLVFIGGKSIEIQNYKSQGSSITGEEIPLITRVILEDNEGLRFSVEPNENGLIFAIGEITYKEYKKIQHKESRQFIWYFFAISGVFFLMCWVFIRWFFI